jgi:hypothetical protein
MAFFAFNRLEDKKLAEELDRKISAFKEQYPHEAEEVLALLQFSHGLMGVHGLPLMGTGDWNDALSHVGEKGKGESVWLGMFLYKNLVGFAPIAESRGDFETASRYRAEAAKLKIALDKYGWNGKYYIRAYMDNGKPLKIPDVIVQSWAVISGVAVKNHGIKAVLGAVKMFYLEAENVILMFKGRIDWLIDHPPGLREYGQYSHGAAWLVMALAMLGYGDLAYRLLGALDSESHVKDGADPVATLADMGVPPEKLGEKRKLLPGWTWYTGSAGVRYNIETQYILGFRIRDGNRVEIVPCIPKAWSEYTVFHQRGKSLYTITVNNPSGVSTGVKSIMVDGKVLADIRRGFELIDDGKPHKVIVTMDDTRLTKLKLAVSNRIRAIMGFPVSDAQTPAAPIKPESGIHEAVKDVPVDVTNVKVETVKAKPELETADADNAQLPKGGIDMNSSNLNLQIKRDGMGVPLPFSQQPLENVRIEGLIPVILNIQPASSVPWLLVAGEK